MNVKDLMVRTLSGAVFAAVVVGATLSGWGIPLLAAAICVGTMYEFYKIARLAGLRPLAGYGMAAGVAFIAANACVIAGYAGPAVLLATIPLPAVFFIAELYRKGMNPMADIGAGMASLLYCSLPLSMLMWMSADGLGGYSGAVALSYFIIIWANDVGAYLVGSAIGRHKLFERVSPNKSWEGFFGGLVFAAGAAAGAAAIFGLDMLVWVPVSVVIAVTGVLGDLVESMFKRSVKIKDSGRMMPGHGGFLDRFDSLLISLPVASAIIILLS